MAKGRHLKPEFFTDKNVVSVTPLARLLYQGLWCYAADCGHLDDEPLELKMRILPGDNCNVDELLDELGLTGRVERKDGVLFLPKLRDHARVDKRYETVCDACKERQKHAVDTTSEGSPSTPNTTSSRSDHDVTTQGSHRDHDADGDGDGDGDGDLMVKAAARQLGESFEEFWTRYPRKVSKGHARKAWKAAVLKVDGDPAVIIDASRAFAVRVHGSDEKFIAHPATWLNGERWLDEQADRVQATEAAWRTTPIGPPAAPPEIADDPERYATWLADWRRETGR